MSDTLRFAGRPEAMVIEHGYDPIGFVGLTAEVAEPVAAHELARRLELGKRRGFGSVRVTARIGESVWQTSLFPRKTGGWFLPVKKPVRLAEGLDFGDEIAGELELL